MPTAGASKKKSNAETAPPAVGEPDDTTTVIEAELPDLAETVFAVGDHVVHPKFGVGRVISTRDDKLTIDFGKVGKKEIVDSFVKRAR